MHRKARISEALLGCIDIVCNLLVMTLLDNPIDLVRASAVSRQWRRFVIENSLCKRLFAKRYPRVAYMAYEADERYKIIRLSDILTGKEDEWGALEKEHRIYSYLLQPLSKRMECPRDCVLIPVGGSSIAESIITAIAPVCTYPLGFSFSCSEGQSETRVDFLKSLETDVAIHVMSFIDEPADVVRLSAVSRFWYRLGKGLVKEMCLKVFPELSTIGGLVLGRRFPNRPAEAETGEKDHSVTIFASLLHAIKNWNKPQRDCVLYAISASSTNNFPRESIGNTLYPKESFMGRPSYWSSTGQSDPEVSETLLYRLQTPISVITGFVIQPLKACFQRGGPVYAAKFVRLRMGHPKSRKLVSEELQYLPLENRCENKFFWTYTSPVYPMQKKNVLQKFELPKPALCLGGYVQIEFIGRAQRQESDGLFYICMSHVGVMGRHLSPAFEMEIEEASGEVMLRYYPQSLGFIMQENTRVLTLQDEMFLLERMGHAEPVNGGDDDDEPPF